MIMSFMLLNKFSIIFFFLLIIISGSLLSTSSAGRRSKFINKLAEDVDAIFQEELELNNEEGSMIHERVLRANARDYGRYDPTPSLSKPPFKLIPN